MRASLSTNSFLSSFSIAALTASIGAAFPEKACMEKQIWETGWEQTISSASESVFLLKRLIEGKLDIVRNVQDFSAIDMYVLVGWAG